MSGIGIQTAGRYRKASQLPNTCISMEAFTQRTVYNIRQRTALAVLIDFSSIRTANCGNIAERYRTVTRVTAKL
jgi:hypothetical protein